MLTSLYHVATTNYLQFPHRHIEFSLRAPEQLREVKRETLNFKNILSWAAWAGTEQENQSPSLNPRPFKPEKFLSSEKIKLNILDHGYVVNHQVLNREGHDTGVTDLHTYILYT